MFMGALLLPQPFEATPVSRPPPPPPLPPKRAKAAKTEVHTPSGPPLPPRGLKYLGEVLDVKRKPLFYQSISYAALKTLSQNLVSNSSKYLQSLLTNSITPEHLSSLTWLFININNLTSDSEKLLQMVSLNEFSYLITDVIDDMVVNNCISCEYHGVLLRDLGLHPGCWPLLVSHNTLSLLARVLIIRSEKEDDPLLINIWKG